MFCIDIIIIVRTPTSTSHARHCVVQDNIHILLVKCTTGMVMGNSKRTGSLEGKIQKWYEAFLVGWRIKASNGEVMKIYDFSKTFRVTN